jgi:hypothetical protein
MVFGGVKRSIHSAANANDLQISKMNCFVFSTMIKMTDSCFCFNYFEGKHAVRAISIKRR